MVSNRTSRRARAIRVCLTCRKHKARCEILDDLETTEVLRCHRCKTLNLECSYQNADRQTLRLGSKPGISQAWEKVVDFTDVGTPSSSTATSNPNANVKPVNSTPDIKTALELQVLPQSIWKYKRIHFGEWRYVGTLEEGRYDWATPMSAVYQISARYLYGQPLIGQAGGQVESLEQILEPTQADDLLRIFRQSYLPWLDFPLIQSDGFPLLNLVCCTIASRHLSQSSFSSISQRLLRAVEHAISQIILHPPPTHVLESIQVLILVALWAPLSTLEEGQRDPHLLLSSAVSLAMSIGLNDAPERYSALMTLKEQGTQVDDRQMVDVADLARLWISLSNIESLSCIGTSRTPFAQRGTAYLNCFPRSPSTLSSSVEVRDIRLRIMADILKSTEEGLATLVTSMDDFDPWCDTMRFALQRIDGCIRMLLPLGVVLDFGQMFFRVQIIISRCCRLLVLYRGIHVGHLLIVHDGRLHSKSYANVHKDVFTPWGRDIMQLCEQIFVELLEVLDILDRNRGANHNTHPNSTSNLNPNDTSLFTAPDLLFPFIQLSGICLISFQFLAFSANKVVLPGSSDALLEKVIKHLGRLDIPARHPAKKCAEFLRGLKELWENREKVVGLASLSSPSPSQQQQQPEEESGTSQRERVNHLPQVRGPIMGPLPGNDHDSGSEGSGFDGDLRQPGRSPAENSEDTPSSSASGMNLNLDNTGMPDLLGTPVVPGSFQPSFGTGIGPMSQSESFEGPGLGSGSSLDTFEAILNPNLSVFSQSQSRSPSGVSASASAPSDMSLSMSMPSSMSMSISAPEMVGTILDGGDTDTGIDGARGAFDNEMFNIADATGTDVGLDIGSDNGIGDWSNSRIFNFPNGDFWQNTLFPPLEQQPER